MSNGARHCPNRRAFIQMAGGAAIAPAFVGWPARATQVMPRGQQITAFTLIHGIPGKEEDLKEHLLSLAAPTRAEPGCVMYDLYQLPDRKHEFLRFEIWSSLEALEAHKKAPHLKASFEKRQREGWTTEIVIWDRVAEK